MADFIRNLLQSAQLHGAKSTVVAPVCWLVVTLLGGIVGVGYSGLPIGIAIAILVLVFVVVAVFLWAFCYFAINNPDALRSEKYGLTKLAIEQSIKGDDVTGLIEDQTTVHPSLPPPAKNGGE